MTCDVGIEWHESVVGGLKFAGLDGIEIGIKTAPEASTKNESWDRVYDSKDQSDVSDIYKHPIFFSPNATIDHDPTTQTDPLNPDSDGDGLYDGWNDANANGIYDEGEARGEDLDYAYAHSNNAGDYDYRYCNGMVNSTETDPLDKDSDDDGIIDSREGGTLPNGTVVRWYDDIDGDGKINALDWDSDGDGLLDGMELGLTYAQIDLEYTKIKAGHFINDTDPTTTTNPYNSDSDGDGISDGEEDANANGARDADETGADDMDSDDDGLLDGEDVVQIPGDPYYYDWAGANIIYVEDENGNRTFYGELSTHDLGNNHGTQKNTTDALSKDTDGDGISDGEELKPQIITDPSTFDSDNDGLSDGQELKGWTVTIIYDRTKEKAKQYHVTSDPWLKDTDNDGISDGDEFKSTSDPRSADTDGDGIPDNREKEGQLTVIEGENPELSDMGVGWSIHYNEWHLPDGLELHFAFFAKDNAGLHRFYIWIAGFGSHQKILDGQTTAHIKFSDRAGANLLYLIDRIISGHTFADIEIEDMNKNGYSSKLNAASVLKQVAELALKAIADFIKWVTDLASKAFDWIWDVIRSMIKLVLQPIIQIVKHWMYNILRAIHTAISEYESTGSVSTETSSDVLSAILGGALGSLLGGLSDVIDSVVSIIKPLLDAVSGLINQVLDFIIPIFTGAFGSGPENREAEGAGFGWNLVFSLLDIIMPPQSEHHSLSGFDIAKIVLNILNGYIGGAAAAKAFYAARGCLIVGTPSDIGGITSAVFSFLFTTLSLILSFGYTLIASSPTATKDDKLTLVRIEGAFGLIGVFLGIGSAISAGLVPVKIFAGLSAVFGAIGIGIACLEWIELEQSDSGGKN